MIFIKKKNFDTLEKKEILTFWKGKFWQFGKEIFDSLEKENFDSLKREILTIFTTQMGRDHIQKLFIIQPSMQKKLMRKSN